MKPILKAFVLRIIGLAVCIIPPVITTLQYFPLWFSETETAVSALSAMLLTLCCLPFLKQIKAYFKNTPSSWGIFLAIWIISMSLNKLMDGIETIAFIGTLSNLVGGCIFRIEKHMWNKVR